MELFTGIANDKFEKWFICEFGISPSADILAYQEGSCFYNMHPLSMQIGIIEDFAESLEKVKCSDLYEGRIKLITDFDFEKGKWFVWILREQRVRVMMRDENTAETMYFSSRNEARIEYVKKLNELLNK